MTGQTTAADIPPDDQDLGAFLTDERACASFARSHPSLAGHVHAMRAAWLREQARPTAEPPLEHASRADVARDGASTGTAIAEGRVLGDYRLVKKIGKTSGMGQVWIAQQISLDRRVALKLLKSGQALSREQVDLLEREARAGGRLHHPMIVAVIAFGEVDGIPFIAQELIGEGDSLADLIDATRQLPAVPDDWYRRIAAFFADAAEGLSVAHAAGVTHRDIKPGNILVADDGRPKIADFGLAKVVGLESLSRSGDVAGTWFYMSPEQAMAKRIGIDHRTDVFSLGATLYEALTLQRAFDGDTQYQVAENILYLDPPEPHRLRSRIPRDLSVICMKALEKRRDHRYASMRDFADDLAAFLGDGPIRARPPGPLSRALRWTRRHPTASVALTIGGAALVVISVLAVTATANAERARDNADMAEASAELALRREEEARRERANVMRLSAFRELERLEREADAMWPVLAERVPAYEAWMSRASALLAGLQPSADGQDPGHLRQLQQLSLRALPATDAEREETRRGHPRAPELDELDAAIAAGEAALTEFGADESLKPTLALIEGELARTRIRRDALSAEIDAAPVPLRFEIAEDAWWYDQLSRLVDALRAFGDPEHGLIWGTSPRHGWGVARRLAFAATIEGHTLTGDEARRRWDEAVTSIADTSECPAYAGLRITPQIGLLPIGRDPESGLWEFWHVASGAEPRRDATGRLVLEEASGMVFVLIPGGTFGMGAQKFDPRGPNFDPNALPTESPVHDVTLSPYLISKFEMTQAQWRYLMRANPSNYDGTLAPPHWHRDGGAWTMLHPVESVSWDDAMEVLGRLGLTLPSEAQWEYACRAGTSTPFSSGASIASLQGVANLADAWAKDNGLASLPAWESSIDDGQTVHAPVGSYRPNAFGLHDTHGNVQEWCLDKESLSTSRAVRDPVAEDGLSESRHFRGGSFEDSALSLRSVYRPFASPDSRRAQLGVRPARALSR